MKITESGVYTDITEIAEELEIAAGVEASFPNLTSIGGSVSVHTNAQFTAPNLTSLGDGVYVYTNAKFTAPNLTSIGGSVSVHTNAKFTSPNLTSIGGSVGVWENAKFTAPNLTSIGGSVHVYQNAKFTVPNLTSIGSDVYVYTNAKLAVPNLTSLGGGVWVRENAKLTAPKLTSVGGRVEVWENAKFTVPKLTSIGGSVWVYTNAEFIRSDVEIAYDPAMLERSFNNAGYTFVDQILAKVVHTRGNVRKVIIAGRNKISYLITDGKFHAHGDTLKQATEDLRFKKISEKIRSEPIKSDTMISIAYYHTVTGACTTGIKHWIDNTFDEAQKKQILDKGIRADELLPILKKTNAYGFAKFNSLVEFAR